MTKQSPVHSGEHGWTWFTCRGNTSHAETALLSLMTGGLPRWGERAVVQCEGQRTVVASVLYFCREARGQSQVTRIAQKVSLLSEPPCWPGGSKVQ